VITSTVSSSCFVTSVLVSSVVSTILSKYHLRKKKMGSSCGDKECGDKKCGGDKQPLLGSSTSTPSSSAAATYGTNGQSSSSSSSPTMTRKEKKEEEQKSSGGGLFGFLSNFTNTDNARTNVKVCCSTGTCSACLQEQQKALLKASTSSNTIVSSPTGGGDRCGSPLNLPCKMKDSDSCSTHRKVALDPTVKDGHTIVRSTIVCKGICCSSEVPELLEILEALDGVAEVKIIVPLKHIIIDHESQVVSATQIVKILNDELFPSTVQRDGGASLPSIVRSNFTSKGICCASEVPQILEILNHYEGVEKVSVNVPLKKVIVEHNCKVISAAQIAKILTDESFETTIESDGGSSTNVAGVEGRSKFHVSQICCASEIPQIRSALEPLNGVKGLMINVATKMVYVDHSSNIISAVEINDKLNEVGLGSMLKYDCFKDAGGFLSSFVMSKFSILPTSPSDSVDNLKGYLKTFDQDQVEGYQLDKKAKTITIIHNPFLITADDLKKSVLDRTGIKTKIEEDGNEGKSWVFPETSEEEDSADDGSSSTSIRPTVVICGVFWITSMLSNFGGTWSKLSYLGLVSVAIGVPPIANKAFRTARRGMIDTNVLMFLAVVGAVCLKMFDEAAAVTFLFSLSEWLEDGATSRANSALTSIVNLKPEVANIIQPKTKELIVVPATSVPVGAMVAVKSGDKIPCDGIVTEGTTTVDESSLTGEARPVKKGPKDTVSGGTVNSGNTQIVVRTTHSSDDSAVSRLIRLVEEAQANRSETEKIVDAFAKVYTPVVVVLAVSLCTIPWLWGDQIGRDWMGRGLSLLVIACPCALVISTPISYVAGLAATAQNGVLIKGGAHLEALGQLKHVCLDKTGTLTVGEFKLLDLDVFGKNSKREDVLQYLALMEERATHPLATSLVDGIKSEGVTISKSLFVKDHTFLAGEGVMGTINNSKVYVGNERLFRRLGMFESIPQAQRDKVESWEAIDGTIGFMSIGNRGVVCAYCVADAPRPEAAQVLKELQDMNIKVHMLTGDKKQTALSIGKKIGLAEGNIESELLPEEKLNLVMKLKAEVEDSNPLLALFFSKPKLVLMCGDGVNDAPSLVAANVGVAMGAGAALAMETADVTLMDSHLTKLSYSIKMGRSVIRKIRENVIFSIFVKVVVLVLTLMNKVGLWAAIATDVGSMIIVTLNGMSLLPKKRITAKPTTSDSNTIEV